jgi:hypothetical protein
MKSALRIFSAICALGVMVSFLPLPAGAQCLCSGRCFLDEWGQAYCGLSAFGEAICYSAIDYCVEWACPIPTCFTARAPESVVAAGVAISPQVLECEAKVVQLKART